LNKVLLALPPVFATFNKLKMTLEKISNLLGDKAEGLLQHQSKTILKETLHLPGGDFVDRSFSPSNRNQQVLNNLQRLYQHGNLGNTGYLSILPVDQGIEHSAGASFAPNPIISTRKIL
jgi:class I fructose-bisphosphate aldolase